MEEKEKPKRSEKKVFKWRFWLMIIMAIAYGIVARLIFKSPFATEIGWDVVSIAFILGVPTGIGIITAGFVQPSKNNPFTGIGLSAAITAVFVSITVFAALEVWICVLMAAVPMVLMAGLVYLFTWVVEWLYNRFFNRGDKPKRMNALVFFFFLLIPYMIAPLEAQIQAPSIYRDLEESILIQSDAETVWNNIIRMDTISIEEQYPTLFQSIGIPRPIRASLEEESLGALRRGEFEHGLMFYEIIDRWQPYEEVHFTIKVNQNNLESPALAQIGGQYFDVLAAGYRIEVLDNGQIRLTLTSRYRLSTSFNDYAVLWADWIMRDFQSYVLRTVKARVEG